MTAKIILTAFTLSMFAVVILPDDCSAQRMRCGNRGGNIGSVNRSGNTSSFNNSKKFNSGSNFKSNTNRNYKTRDNSNINKKKSIKIISIEIIQ